MIVKNILILLKALYRGEALTEIYGNGKRKLENSFFKGKPERSDYDELFEIFFDKEYYLKNNKDLEETKIDPYFHFINQGIFEGRFPNEIFHPLWYKEKYKKILLNSKYNEFEHFVLEGWKMGLDPAPIFQTSELINKYGFTDTNFGKVPLFLVCKTSELWKISYYRESSERKKWYKNKFKYKSKLLKNKDLKTFAFYLTQYHPIGINNKVWGRGFTEWTNVSKAKSHFFGHQQPILPGEFGFYDLRIKKTIEKQIDLARNYGITGFCFYYYWFNGKRLLEKPLDLFIDVNKKYKFPYVIIWANENWTKTWDGLDTDIIVEQSYEDDYEVRFIKDVEEILCNVNYLRINGCPVIIIYKTDHIPNLNKLIKNWRQYWQKKYKEGLYIIGQLGLKKSGNKLLDGFLQFPPNGIEVQPYLHKRSYLNERYYGVEYLYDDFANKFSSTKHVSGDLFRTSFPSWDNSPRKNNSGHVVLGSTPEKFRNWVLCNMRSALNMSKSKQILFINAWNEWAEGAHLEPDRENGYAYLQAFSDAKTIALNEKLNKSIVKNNNYCLICHLFYEDLVEDIKHYIENIEGHLDLYFTIPEDNCSVIYDRLKEIFPESKIFIYENRGRDILPFLKVIEKLTHLRYEFCLKLHGKKSIHREDGDKWRNDLFSKLCDESVLNGLINWEIINNIGIIGPADHFVHGNSFVGGNLEVMKSICRVINVELDSDNLPGFFGGSMFWIRPEIVDVICCESVYNLFHIEVGELDGTAAHAVERLFVPLAKARNLFPANTRLEDLDYFGQIGNLWHKVN